MNKALKIKAQNSEDLAVLSSLLQDGIVFQKDLNYDREERRLIILVNRFCWETQKGKSKSSSSAKGRGFFKTLFSFQSSRKIETQEDVKPQDASFEVAAEEGRYRVLSALTFLDVEEVQTKNWPFSFSARLPDGALPEQEKDLSTDVSGQKTEQNKLPFLELLAVRQMDKQIQLDFSGAHALRLVSSDINVYLEDVGEAYPTLFEPEHQL